MIRAVSLPAAAVALVAAVLGVQVQDGGGDFRPRPPGDPCASRTIAPAQPGIDGLVGQLVLLGLDRAACRLHVTREALALQLAGPDGHGPNVVGALRDGLHEAIARLEAAGRLPKLSTFTDQALAGADLPDFLKSLVRRLPASLIDAALPARAVLDRAVDDMDLAAVLSGTGDPDGIQQSISTALRQAVQQQLLSHLPGHS